ncbi:LacI family DNA-binding transcriptional regulator [Zafaria sp. Z1313]|uniref:LacI family DNA-binding transcriptional regulator n=1 Tax=unclassified Zafaria TaxID=2828765 RepID=UPI002E77C823|nr:LacI family DNA-binding transcriptional regulator [Zafaria sp. J156]MEE1621809.1 LacI family DNA-binding transcriptional regulator [Zafaria sp. J156]
MPPPGETPKPATIYDVARLAGVSASTVSRAFARPGRVSFATAERIRQVAAELGYRSVDMRRPMAEGRQRHGTIALVIADISNPVFIDMIRGAEEEAAKNNYTMLLAHTRESGIVEREAIERVMDIVDGILLSSSRMSDAAIRAMAKQKPTLVMNRGVSGVGGVVTDNARGMRRALEHLGELGHHELTYLAGPEASWAHGMRWRALKEGALELGLKVSMVQCPAPTREGGESVAGQVLATGTTAVLGYNDQLAIGFMRRAQASGYDVPGDISVVGFDNSPVAELITPGLTSVAAPLHALGAAAVRNLLVLSHGTVQVPERPVVLPTRLVVRRSTGPARA